MLFLIQLFLFVNLFLFILCLMNKGSCRIMGVGPITHPTIEFHICSGCMNWTLLYLHVSYAWRKGEANGN